MGYICKTNKWLQTLTEAVRTHLACLAVALQQPCLSCSSLASYKNRKENLVFEAVLRCCAQHLKTGAWNPEIYCSRQVYMCRKTDVKQVLAPFHNMWLDVFSYYQAFRVIHCTVKPVLSGHSKRRPKIGFKDRLSLNAGQTYCRMLQETYIKLPSVFKTFVLSIFEWPLKTGFAV